MKEFVGHYYRRVVFTAVFTLFGAILISGPTLAAFLAGAAAAIAAVFMVYAMPKYRKACESGAIGLFVAALIPIPADALPPAIVGLAFLSHSILYGQWSDSLGLNLSVHAQHKGELGGQAEDVWLSLVPAEGHPSDFWNPDLIDYNRDPEDTDTVYLRFRDETGLVEEMTLTFVAKTTGNYCRYFLERAEPLGRDDMTVTIAIAEIDDGLCLVETQIEQDALPPRIALARWFDNQIGVGIDGVAAALKGNRALKLQQKPNGKIVGFA